MTTTTSMTAAEIAEDALLGVHYHRAANAYDPTGHLPDAAPVLSDDEVEALGLRRIKVFANLAAGIKVWRRYECRCGAVEYSGSHPWGGASVSTAWQVPT